MADSTSVADYFFKQYGWCPICEAAVEFTANGPYFRATLKCSKCNSMPRERALIYTIQRFFPKWRDMKIHESSPSVGMPASWKLYKQCAGYLMSQYDTDIPFGSTNPEKNYRSENLEQQTFPAESFDIVVTQDVFEHIMRPDLAIREIARTLKPGGAHICTVPLVNGIHPSRRRAVEEDGHIVHLLDPIYHGNPLKKSGSLVTIDWGFDIAAYFQTHSGLSVINLEIDDISKGIHADLIHVLVCIKGGAAANL